MASWPAAVAVLSWALLGPAHTSPLPQDTPGGVVQRIGSSCSSPEDCQQVDNGMCNRTTGTCQCLATHPIPNEISCLKAAFFNESCTITRQCRNAKNLYAECASGVCACGAKSYPHTFTADQFTTCLLSSEQNAEARKTPVDPVMIGTLATLVLMFVIICVVLRIFSKARFRQTRTILNSANPRLMNASFLKGSLIKSPVEQLRGSRSSRGSRAPSMTSLERAEGAAAAFQNEGRRTSLARTEGTDAGQVHVEVTGHGH